MPTAATITITATIVVATILIVSIAKTIITNFIDTTPNLFIKAFIGALSFNSFHCY